MSRRRPLRVKAKIRNVTIFCTGRPHREHDERDVAVVKINLDDPRGPRPEVDERGVRYRREPRDDWWSSDLYVGDESQRMRASDDYRSLTVGPLRCPVPTCTPVLKAGAEMADRLMDAVIEANLRRVELGWLVGIASTLVTNSRNETGDVADL